MVIVQLSRNCRSRFKAQVLSQHGQKVLKSARVHRFQWHFHDNWANSICWGRLCDTVESSRPATKFTLWWDSFLQRCFQGQNFEPQIDHHFIMKDSNYNSKHYDSHLSKMWIVNPRNTFNVFQKDRWKKLSMRDCSRRWLAQWTSGLPLLISCVESDQKSWIKIQV